MMQFMSKEDQENQKIKLQKTSFRTTINQQWDSNPQSLSSYGQFD